MAWKIAIKSSKLKPGKKKMLTVGKKIILVGRFDEDDGYYATEALCRHMRWPLAYGGKVKDDCITCPLHQTTHNIETGELIDFNPEEINLNKFPKIPTGYVKSGLDVIIKLRKNTR